ncbi:MAG: macro domain-containing protein [Pseudobutyrivibrio sp.]|nr:macro domain-containing protein [Pseudobutyrivibrio sp.]
MPFQIIRNDITKVKADAIVNTANPKPCYSGGTDSAIYLAAGEDEMLAARQKIGAIPRGQAVETPAFKLNAKYVIHTVGPIWEGGDRGEFEILKSCYENSLNLALKLKCKSIAFPLIATGVYGFPKDKALQIAMSVIEPFLMEHSMKVILVVFDRQAFELSGKVVENVLEYVDSNYVEEASEKEYSIYENRARGRGREVEDICYARCMSLEEESEENLAPTVASPVKVNIFDFINTSEKTFQERLFEIIDERGLTGPEVYKDYISKQVYSKIQADRNYHPNKYTAIALCLSLRLNVEETQDLIGRAGWTLSPSNKADLVVKGCIINKEYSVVNINLILFECNCPELEKIK